MISIAGRHVLEGDSLYHTGLRAWGVVSGYDSSGSAKLLFTGSGQPRTIYVQQGGRVNGIRVIYWHEPLLLDLPFQNVTKYQRLLDSIVAEFPS